ncbi:MAG: EamA family transporter [Thermoanaerobaculia bacterium]
MGTHRPRLIAAFAAVYLIWGSTYLAIRIGLEGWPPFLLGGVRFLIAGAILYGISRWRLSARARSSASSPGAAGIPHVRPSGRAWARAALTGGLLFLGGHGAVVWAEQTVPSGVAALLVASEPLWIVVLTALIPGEARPGWRSVAGLLAGFTGVALIIDPGGRGVGDPVAAAAIVAGSLSWAVGSLIGRSREGLPVGLVAGMQMLAGGALLTAVGALNGELGRFDAAAAWGRPSLALVYLIVCGSLVAYTAYAWLLGAAAPTTVASYAYVNPVVALLLGALLADEAITGRIVLGGLIVVAAVAFVVIRSASRSGASPGTGTTDPVTERRLTMLARMWSGEVPAERADDYEAYLEATGLAEYRATSGNRGAWVLRRDKERTTEFVTFSLWDDWDAVRRFAGPEPERARYYPEDRDYLLELRPTVDHFQVVLGDT